MLAKQHQMLSEKQKEQALKAQLEEVKAKDKDYI